MECLLCLETKHDETKCIHVESMQWQDLNIKCLIDKHLWPIDTYTSISCVCSSCWQELNDFHKFYARIEVIHCDSKLLLKTETDPFQEEKKPKDILLKTLLEPEITIEKIQDRPMEIKQEAVDPDIDVPLTPSNVDSVDIFADDQEQDRAVVDDSGSSDSNDSEEISDSEDDLPLIQRNKKSVTTRRKSKDTNETEETPNTENKRSPCKKNDIVSKPPAVKRNVNSKPSNLPKVNRLEYDKFLKEHFKITCDKCQETFEKFRQLCQHYRKEHKEQGYALCCGDKFFKRRLLVDHTNFHLNPEYFKCELCGKVFTKRICLIGHMKMHEEKKFCCDICDKKFVLKHYLDKHKLTHMPQSEKKFPCNECGKFYANEYMLNQHQKSVHLNIYARICEICGETFPDSPTFKKHMERHDGILPLKTATCDQCGLIVTNQQTLKLHIERKHPVGGKRDYNCHICSKVSPNEKALKKHIREAHELGYRFKCTICDKEFKRADNFKSHMAIHTGTPLHRCLWCPKEFYSNGNMHQHRKKAHPVEWEEAQRKKYSGKLPPNYKPPSTLNSQYEFKW